MDFIKNLNLFLLLVTGFGLMFCLLLGYMVITLVQLTIVLFNLLGSIYG